nr:hypothetical protein [Tanacetum cinerariifolium]
YVVPTGRVVVHTGMYVVSAGNVIVVSTGRLSVIPTSRVLSPAMDSEAIKDRAVESFKRPREELESNKSKKQKLDENVKAEVADDDTAKLKRCMEIVSEDDDEVKIEATPLSSISPTIVNYKIFKEEKKSYFKIIRADGNSQNYITFGTMWVL